ncbi:MAG: class I SAM-dependent methyltransferase [Chloroherpetonaceae bacterium]|nr:class I SAM-dependent methyltransferase [Chloroherpetonaceae bacterium]
MGNTMIPAMDWNLVAKEYAEKLLTQPEYFESYDSFISLFPSLDSEVLDIGCGPASISKYIHEKRPQFRITGIDTSHKMLEYAQHNCPDSFFYLHDARDLSSLKENRFQEKQFDGITIGFCIPYLNKDETKKLLLDCTNRIKPGGAFYLSFIEAILPNHKSEGIKNPESLTQITLYSLEEMKQLLLLCGFVPLFHFQSISKTSFVYKTVAIVSLFVPKMNPKP